MSHIFEGPGFWFLSDWLKHPAWLTLPGTSKNVLVAFWNKRLFSKKKKKSDKKKLLNEDQFYFTYLEAEKTYGISNMQFSRAIDTLLAHGWITIIHQGGAKDEDRTMYGLSEAWRLWVPKKICETRSKCPKKGRMCYRRIKTTNENVRLIHESKC